MKKIIVIVGIVLMIISLFSCAPKVYHNFSTGQERREFFSEEGINVYHINDRGLRTKLTWRDLMILNIDSLKDYHSKMNIR